MSDAEEDEVVEEEKEEEVQCFQEIEPKLQYEMSELFPRFQPFDRDDTAYLVANKMEAHRVWKNSLVKAYKVVLDKDEFLEQVMTIFFAFNCKRDSGRLAFEYHCFLSDIRKDKIIEKVTHIKMFITTPDGSYTQAYLTANPLKITPKKIVIAEHVEDDTGVKNLKKAPRKPRTKPQTSSAVPKTVENIIGQKPKTGIV